MCMSGTEDTCPRVNVFKQNRKNKKEKYTLPLHLPRGITSNVLKSKGDKKEKKYLLHIYSLFNFVIDSYD